MKLGYLIQTICSLDRDGPGEWNYFEFRGYFDNRGHQKFYDWLLVLPQEVNYIWCASWKWTKVLYLLTRYIPFAGMGLMLLGGLLLR